MNDLIIRGLGNPRVLNFPITHTGCPHKHEGTETETTELVPKTVIKRNHTGNVVLDNDKRRELWEKFEKDLGLEEKLNPMDEPVVARVLKVNGTVSRAL